MTDSATAFILLALNMLIVAALLVLLYSVCTELRAVRGDAAIVSGRLRAFSIIADSTNVKLDAGMRSWNSHVRRGGGN